MKGIQDRNPTIADKFQLAVFAYFVFSYSLYMNGLIPQFAYFIALLFLTGVCVLRISYLKFARNTKIVNLPFGMSSFVVFIAAFSLLAISTTLEVVQTEGLTSTSLVETFYILTPLIIALGIVITIPNWNYADVYITVLLLGQIFIFLFDTEFSLSLLTQISWKDSFSPFESSFAHDLLVIEVYFLFRNKQMRAITGAILTMLSFKRASALIAPALFLFRRQLGSKIPPGKGALFVLATSAIFAPFIVQYLYSKEGKNHLQELLGLNVDSFTSGRSIIYRYASELPHLEGLGHLNQQLTDLVTSNFGTKWNSLLHNDTLRLLLEVGFIGLIIYVLSLVYLARISRYSIFLIAYTLFTLTTSRLITAFSFWVVLFLVLALIERGLFEQKNPKNQRNLATKWTTHRIGI